MHNMSYCFQWIIKYTMKWREFKYSIRHIHRNSLWNTEHSRPWQHCISLANIQATSFRIIWICIYQKRKIQKFDISLINRQMFIDKDSEWAPPRTHLVPVCKPCTMVPRVILVAHRPSVLGCSTATETATTSPLSTWALQAITPGT